MKIAIVWMERRSWLVIGLMLMAVSAAGLVEIVMDLGS